MIALAIGYHNLWRYQRELALHPVYGSGNHENDLEH
jgi:hypothetical protein